jgi:hypothetical protein
MISYTLSKESLLKSPYKSRCDDYLQNRPFGSKSQNQCLKMCSKKTEKNDCLKLCPNDCIRDEYEMTTLFSYKSNEDNSQISIFFKWDSEKPFIHYIEKPNMLLIDYFTYIGGLFGLWFCICLSILIELLINYFRFLRNFSLM